jgi:regulator of cell morphogenesis and NO signaling
MNTAGHVSRGTYRLMSHKKDGMSDHHWKTVRLRSLTTHIIETHHRYLKKEFPAVESAAGRLAQHASDGSTIKELYGLIKRLWRDLELQMGKEESILFPAILEIEAKLSAHGPEGFSQFGSVANLARSAAQDYAKTSRMLEEAKALAYDYTRESGQQREAKALLDSLASVATDLRHHIHLENEILLPRAVALERGASESQ